MDRLHDEQPEHDERPERLECSANLIEIALHDSDVIKSGKSIEQLKGLTIDDDTIKLIVKSTTDPDPEVRRRSVRLCHVLHASAVDVLSLLSKALTDPVWTVREAAALVPASARSARTAETSELLVQCALRDKSQFVRDAAVRSLVSLADHHEKIVDDLVIALSDQKPPVRCRAAIALGQFQDRTDQFLPALIKRMDDSHRRVRKTAVTVVGQIASAASGALPALIARRYDGDVQVSESAALAIKRVLKSYDARHVAVFGNLQSNPEPALQSTWASTEISPDSRCGFEQLCRNRKKWWREKLNRPNDDGAEESDWLLIASVLDLADNKRREAAWLLRRFAELMPTDC